ncbi:phage tail tape measure protein [Streptomyces noursei]|uniref:phage tail tape measure protein n=1 Tax=Streptomyces noursei TaxID=1971 RepID=UPI003633F6D8
MAARPIRITLLGDVSDLTDALGDASNQVSAFGEKAKKLAAVAGAGIAAGIGAGIMEALDREAGTDKLAAQLGATPAEAKKLGEAAGAVYSAGYGESVADANEALKGLWQQGLVPAGATADEMANISKKAMDVASVLGDDVGPTANAVGTMLKTGMAANAKEAFDILVVGAQNGSNKAEDLLDTFNEYSVQFKRVGLDGKTAMGLISQGLQAGARDSDQVADAIGQFGEKAVAGGTAVEEAFKSIGLNADDIAARMGKGGKSAEQALTMTLNALRGTKDETVKLNAAAALFGDPANVMGDALYALNPATAAASNGLDKVDGAASRAGETMHNNAKTKITAFTRSLQTGVVDFLGGTVIPAVESLARSFAPVASAAQNVASWIMANQTPISIVAGLITLVMLPALIAWGVQATTAAIANVTAWVTSTATATTSAATQVLAHWSVVGGWLKAAGQAAISGAVMVGQWVLMGAQAMLQAARMAAAWLIAMGPVAIVIAAVVGLAALIWANWDKIKAWTGEAFQWVWDKIKGVFEWLKNLFLNFTGPGLIIKHWDKIKEATAAAFQYVKDKAKAGIQGVIDFFTSLPGRIANAAGAVKNAALNIGRMVIDGIKNGLSKLGGFATSLASSVAGAAKGAINGVIDLLNWAIPDRLGWGKFSISLPANPIPKIRAMGGPTSGWTRVGERGPEWVNLPGGSAVVPNHASPNGGVVVNVTSNADPYEVGRQVAWALRVAPR